MVKCSKGQVRRLKTALRWKTDPHVRADRHRLEAIVADRSAPQKHVWRANIVERTSRLPGRQRCHTGIRGGLQAIPEAAAIQATANHNK
jgi:hypothetical protein